MHPDIVGSSTDVLPVQSVPFPETAPQTAVALPVAPPVAQPDPALSDQMQAQAVPAEKPAAAPDLWPFLKLPRRKRADFMRRVAPIFSAEDEFRDMAATDPNGAFDPGAAARAFDLMADIEDTLRIAVPPGAEAAFEDYVLAADDDELMTYLNWYMRTFQPGEAPASSS